MPCVNRPADDSYDARGTMHTLQLIACARSHKPNTHRRRRRDSAVELSRVGGVNALVGSRDPVYNYYFSCAVSHWGWWQVTTWWRHCLESYQYRFTWSIWSVWSVSKLFSESVGSRRELVANCVHTADADAMQLDSWVASAVYVLDWNGSQALYQRCCCYSWSCSYQILKVLRLFHYKNDRH